MSDAKPPPANPYAAAVDRLREQAKWIITVFAGLGAVLIAGTQLSSVGRLDPGTEAPRLVLATLAVLVALAAIARIIWAAVNVTTAGEATLAELEALETAQASRTGGEAGADDAYAELARIRGHELLDAFESIAQLRRRRAQVLASYRAALTGEGSPPPAPADGANLVQVAARVKSVSEAIISASRYHRVEREFLRTRRTMFWAGGVAAVAVMVAAWALNPRPPAAPDASPYALPAAGRMLLTAEGRDLLAPRLGAACVSGGAANGVPVVVLGAAEGVHDVVVVPSERCRTARLSVGGGVGTVLAAERVRLGPSASAAPAADSGVSR